MTSKIIIKLVCVWDNCLKVNVLKKSLPNFWLIHYNIVRKHDCSIKKWVIIFLVGHPFWWLISSLFVSVAIGKNIFKTKIHKKAHEFRIKYIRQDFFFFSTYQNYIIPLKTTTKSSLCLGSFTFLYWTIFRFFFSM